MNWLKSSERPATTRRDATQLPYGDVHWPLLAFDRFRSAHKDATTTARWAAHTTHIRLAWFVVDVCAIEHHKKMKNREFAASLQFNFERNNLLCVASQQKNTNFWISPKFWAQHSRGSAKWLNSFCLLQENDSKLIAETRAHLKLDKGKSIAKW